VAIIYGRPDSEIEILRRSPRTVEKFEDIATKRQKLKDGLAEEKKDFFEKVPSKISTEEQKLEKIKDKEKITEQKFNEKIKKLEEKKAEGGFSGFSASFKKYFVKNYSKKKEINKIKELEKKQELHIDEWKENPEGIFNNIQKETISEIKEFDKVKKDHFYLGAKGELSALDVFSQLPDDFHVFCGVDVELSKYVTYNGKRNLKSAQMDFVVVSKRGVVLIEVKHWTAGFYKKNRKLSPHEQVDRASRVLWIALQSWRSPKSPRVKPMVLSTRTDIPYDTNFKFVSTSNLQYINEYLQKRPEEFSEKEVERLVDRVKKFVTT